MKHRNNAAHLPNADLDRLEFNEEFKGKQSLPVYSPDIGTYGYINGAVIKCPQLHFSLSSLECNVEEIIKKDLIRKLIYG
jgi:hypothetical protein